MSSDNKPVPTPTPAPKHRDWEKLNLQLKDLRSYYESFQGKVGHNPHLGPYLPTVLTLLRALEKGDKTEALATKIEETVAAKKAPEIDKTQRPIERIDLHNQPTTVEKQIAKATEVAKTPQG